MIIYVVTESEKNAKSGAYYSHKLTLEEVSGEICLIIRYNQLTLELLRELNPLSVCHSGCNTSFDEYDVLQNSAYKEAVTEWNGAQIGFCGGHQILAHIFGSSLNHMRTLREGDADHNPGYHPGLFKEWGVYPVRILKEDPLFDGFAKVFRVHEFHKDEVKELGSDLALLASSDDCRVQVFRHRNKPVYGTQFHPEQASVHYPDGFRILKNFFKIAREFHLHRQTPVNQMRQTSETVSL
jgi:GMP synthase (glutamine-hydrolysing)